jgi:hypothetical protein
MTTKPGTDTERQHALELAGFAIDQAIDISAAPDRRRHPGRTGSLTARCQRAFPEPLSYILYYNGAMADTITFRPDEDAARALEILTRDGTPVSTAVRTALIESARRQASERIRAEAAALASDEDDRVEAAQVLRDMETLRAW